MLLKLKFLFLCFLGYFENYNFAFSVILVRLFQLCKLQKSRLNCVTCYFSPSR